MKIGKKHNNLIGYFVSFFTALSFDLPIRAFFFTDYLGFSFAQASLIFSLSMLSSMIFEVPSGAWADKWGRKKILMLGFVLMGIATTTYLRAHSIEVYFINELVRGVGYAMMSGCLVSLIYDRYKEKKKTVVFDIFTRRNQMVLFGSRAISAIGGGYLFSLHETLPYRVLTISFIMAMVGVAFLYETKNKDNGIKEDRQGTINVIIDGRKHLRQAQNGDVLKVMYVYLGGGFVASILWQLYQPLFDVVNFDINQIGYLYATASVISLIGSSMVKKIYKGEFPKRVLQVSFIVQVLTGLGLLFLPGWWKVMALVPVHITYGWYRPVMNSYLNHAIPSSHRSTVNSIHSLFDALLFFVAGSIAGYLLMFLGFNNIFILFIVVSVIFFLRATCTKSKEITEKKPQKNPLSKIPLR